MPLPFIAILTLSQVCAPSVAPKTLAAIVLAESSGDPLAIGVNGPKPYAIHVHDIGGAVRAANALIASGANFDVGLGQINSRNLAGLGLSVADAFDSCRNLAATARLLVADFVASDPARDAQAALRTSLSLYNTGDPGRGFRNGYVAKVMAAARVVVPALDPNAADPGGTALTRSAASRAATSAAWDVFARSTSAVAIFVIHPLAAEPTP